MATTIDRAKYDKSQNHGSMSDHDVTRDDTAIARSTVRDVNRRILPFLFVLYIFNFLDRSNVGFAALSMNKDLGFSAAAFGLGAGIFFIGYSLFEVPSNLALVKFGARRWIARIMISWGLIATALMFVRSPLSFYILRFLLGVAEAGFFPAIIYYLSRWYPASMRATSAARFMIAIPLSGLLGGPLGGFLMSLEGRGGLHGWQWLFLVEGLPSVLLGFVVLRYLTEIPAEANWLRTEQREWLMRRLSIDQAKFGEAHGLPPLHALLNPLIWVAALPGLLVTTSGYAYLFWGPTLMRDALGISTTTMGWLGAVIACLCAGSMLIAGRISDRNGERVLHAAACAALVGIAAIGAALFAAPLQRVICIVIMQMAVMSFLAPMWAVPTMLLSGTSAAVGIALVNAIGNIGGFIAPNLVGALHNRAGGDTVAFLVLAGMSLTAAGICVILRKVPALRRETL